MPTPPNVHPCLIDLEASLCHVMQKNAAGTWDNIGDLPIDQLDNYFAFTPQDVLAIKKYSQDLATWITKNAK